MKTVTKNIFHIHTKRCQHASDEADHLYIERALEIGAKSITFTDHAPFPGNPFGNRMRYDQLEEYIETLSFLREQYKAHIHVGIGLEIEYLPSFQKYYEQLAKSKQFDTLMIGQHFYEIKPGQYSFSESEELLNTAEAIGCTKAIVDGIQTGIFQVVAHPDRIFRRRNRWGEEETSLAKQIVQCANMYNVILEQNASSKKCHQYRDEFWFLCKDNKTIQGLDAHCVGEID